MVRGGALETLRRALSERCRKTAGSGFGSGSRSGSSSSAAGGAEGGSGRSDPLLRLIRDIMERLVNDSDAGGDFMRSALRAAAQ
jgi:hypothetical protein